jgi:DNA-directed RNA polymerase subunit M/transcription elongation factor TFIIS
MAFDHKQQVSPIADMIAAYVARHLPSSLTKQFLLQKPTAQDARLFCAGYNTCPTALNHSSLSALLQTPELWLLTTEQAVERQEWLREAYPTHIKSDVNIEKSILVCVRCQKRSVDYCEKQTRGADEPMTVFAHCLACNKRWTQ